MIILKKNTIFCPKLLFSALLLLLPWNMANAQCYQFSSGSTASLTLNITNLPQPIVSSDTHGTVTYKYDFRGLPGNRAKAAVGATVSTSSEFPLLEEASNESTFSLTIAYGPDIGTTFEVLVVANNGLMEAHVFLHARADRDHPKGLLPDGLPPIIPPPSAWSEATFLGIILNQRHAYIPVSGKVDTIRGCTGTSDQPLPPQACGPLPEAHRNRARLSLQDAPEPGPFNFREAYLLDQRMRIESNAEHFNPSHSENMFQSAGPSPAQPMIPDLNDPAVYRSSRWLGLLSEADRFLQMGSFKVAEARYLTILDKLTEAHGPCSDSVAYMHGRLGQLYLRLRDFDRAYTSLLAAVQARRSLLQAAKDDSTRDLQRLQLIGLLNRLGELDLGQGDLDRADEELAEAAALCNDPSCLRDVRSLYALYFRSLVLERQGKWRQAEELWLQATEARQELLPREHRGTERAAEAPSPQAARTRTEMLASEFYWDALKEMAAFYARRGAIHEAAAIARQVVQETGRPRKIEADDFDEAPPDLIEFAQYRIESDLAMSEILALDAWQSSGPAAAAALLTDPNPLDMMVDNGTDADRAQLLAWVQRRVFLYMSVLLDGASSGKNVDRAYEQLMTVKGRFLTSQRNLMRLLEQSWYNPQHDMPQRLALLNQLSQWRAYHAHLFMAGILGGTPVDPAEIAGAEMTEASITAALTADPASESTRGFPSRPRLESDEALIDFVEWQRTDRRTLTLLPSEYGAFVSSAGAPVHFVALGPAAEIDQDIELLTLNAKVIKGKSTGDIQQALRRLYTKVLAPLALWLPRPSSRGIPRIFVIPHGKLTLAPIAALLDPDGRYFLERYQVSYMVDSQAFFEVADSGWATSRPVVFANPDFTMSVDGSDGARPWPSRTPLRPLPGSATEADEMAKLLSLAPDHFLLGKLAREEVVRGLLGPKLLHFATHGMADTARDHPSPAPWRLFEFPDILSAQNPFLHSYIALAGANRQQAGPEDGLLTALEVQSLHLGGTELVVLSSCESGFGTTVDGLGLTGLRAAFWRAGAKGLVTNLWPADDEASHRFMSFFYSHLGNHGGPAEALRQAQLDMKKTTDFSHPFYWAGYSYTGRSQPLQLASTSGDTPWKNREILVNPTCFEISARTGENGQATHHKLLIQLGPMARLQEQSAVKAVYEFFLPGSDVEYSESVSVEGKPPVVNFFTRVASRSGDRILLTVNRSQKESSVVIQTLSTRIATGTPLYSVMLKGDPDLFSSLAVPQALPPLSAYREATLGGTASAPVTIDRIATCSLESSTQ